MSTSARSPGASISAASPCPTSRNVTRSARGGRGRARADGQASASASPASPPARATARTPQHDPGERAAGRAQRAARARARAPSSHAPKRATRPTYAPSARIAASSDDRRPRRDGPERTGREREPEQRRDGRQREQVRGQAGDQRRAAEVHERDRRGGQRAGERDRERAAQAAAARACPRASCGCAGARPWIAATAANESWKPGPDDRPRIEREHRGRREREQMPRIASRADQPGQRHEHARRCGAHDRRPAADDRRVGDDRGDRAAVCERSRHAGDPRESEHRCDEQHDVAARHGQQMREPRRAERLERVVVERRGAAQRDARRDARRPVVAAGGERGARAAGAAVEHALDAAAPSDDGDRACAPSVSCTPWCASQVRRSKLAGGGRHRRERAADLDDRRPARARRARAARRDGRASCAIAELPNGPGRGWPSTDDPRARRRARRARAADRPRARRARGPTRPRRRARRPGRRRRSGRRSGVAQWSRTTQREHDERTADRTRLGQRRQREPDRQPGRGRHAELVDAGAARHRASRGRSASSRTGPMPLTSSSSSTERNPPCATR